MGSNGNFVIATKKPLEKLLLFGCILDWFELHLTSLDGISPEFVLPFIECKKFGPVVVSFKI